MPTDGGAEVTEKGVVWNTSGSPTVSDGKTIDGSGSGLFTSRVIGLNPNTTYYLRAYATNKAGTAYGEEKTFTTLAAIIPPTVTTTAISSIMVTTANSGGDVTEWGGDTVKIRGICWNTTGNPTINDNKTTDGSGLGVFTSSLTGLIQNTKYYVRAYATNSAGTGYGDEINFTTQSPSPDITKIVAKDGSGDYTTVQAAFDAVPDNYTGKWTIYIKPGVYKEKLLLAKNKVNVILKGDHPDSVILTYDDYAGKSNGAGGTIGTSGSYSVSIEPNDFVAMDITFQNTVINDGTFANQQAVALRTNGDRQSYYRCKLKGYQDTYYTYGLGRVYMKDCYIEGSVDFIFGQATVYFDSCELKVLRNGGPVTAASTNVNSKFGYVFRNCKIMTDAVGFDGNAITGIYLGRPWQGNPKVAYLFCEEPASLAPAGWTNMSAGLNPVFAEYKCFGPGYKPESRSTAVDYKGIQLTDEEAAKYTVMNVFARTTNSAFTLDWIPDTNVLKLKQIINIPSSISKKYGDADFTIEATSSSKLPLSLSIENSAIAAINNNSVTIKNAGTTNIIAQQDGNFMYAKALAKTTLNIAKADLTATADDKTKKAGDDNPQFTITYSGFVNGDDVSKITPPIASTTATKDSPEGTYPITLSGGSADNYNIILVNGTLSVTKGNAINFLNRNSLKVYPNPAKDYLIIENIDKINNIEIYNIQGEKILEKSVELNIETIDLTYLKSGIYFVRVNNTYFKFIKQ